MKLAYSRDLCGYYNDRIEDIANAVRYLDPGCMSNGYNDMAYGFNKRGELVIGIHRQSYIDIVFRDTRMEVYHANSYGIIIDPDKHLYIDYDTFNDVGYEFARKLVDIKIKAFSSISIDDADHYVVEHHEASPVFNKDWRAYMNHNIEQIRDAYEFIGDNLKYGQAYIAINSMSRLCILLHHHASFKQYTSIAENEWNNAIIVELQGDGIIEIYDADEYGMPKEDQGVCHYDRLMDSHGTGNKTHEKFVEKVKKNHGVHLI